MKTHVGTPGEYPFTRGIFADGYQGRLWTIRQYSGLRHRRGIERALQVPAGAGPDRLVGRARPADAVRLRPDASDGALGDRQGRRLAVEPERSGDPVPGPRPRRRSRPRSRSTAPRRSSMRCTSPSPTSRACRASKLTGTIQNDILKEYVARGTWIFPVRPSMRLIADSILYSNDVTPRFNPISIAGAHVRDAGCHRRRGDGLHAGQRPGLRGRAAAPRRRRREVRQAAVVLLLRPHGLLRRDREVPRRPPAVGEAA